MSFQRASATATRVLARPARLPGARASSRAWWSQRTTSIARRRYATSGGAEHETPKASSDMPWIIGAVTVTVPTAYYMLQPGEDVSHGHGHGEEAEAEKAEEHKKEVEQPTPARVEAKAEQASVTAKSEEEREEEVTKSEAQVAEEQTPDEEKNPEEAGGPGTHPVVPDTAKQSPEAPSKKDDESSQKEDE